MFRLSIVPTTYAQGFKAGEHSYGSVPQVHDEAKWFQGLVLVLRSSGSLVLWSPGPLVSRSSGSLVAAFGGLETLPTTAFGVSGKIGPLQITIFVAFEMLRHLRSQETANTVFAALERLRATHVANYSIWELLESEECFKFQDLRLLEE